MAEQEEQEIPKEDPSSKKRFLNPTNNIYLTKPARRQVKKGSSVIRKEFTDHSSDYNIWYHKKLGDRFDTEERVKAATRCIVTRDSGYTKADKTNRDTYFCIYFARGHCVNGAECVYYHRIPTIDDELRLDLTHDIFGRERHRSYRDDMGGVGSFSRDNKTLYISGLKRAPNLEDNVIQHFVEWGELSYVKVVWDKAVAFVRYKLRCTAEFAKEAMQDQSLESDEVLAIRWSNEDPNPSAKEKEEEELYMQLAKRVAERKRKDEPVYAYKNPDPNAPPRDSFPSEYYPNQYPHTDDQYPSLPGANPVHEWLQGLGLELYSESFLSAGFYDLASVSQLDEYGLDAAGVVNLDHRTTLLSHANWLQQTYFSNYAQDPSAYQEYTNNQQFLFTNAEYTGVDPNTGYNQEQTIQPSESKASLVEYE